MHVISRKTLRVFWQKYPASQTATSTIAPEIKQQWAAIAPYLTIRNDREYELAVERLNALKHLSQMLRIEIFR